MVARGSCTLRQRDVARAVKAVMAWSALEPVFGKIAGADLHKEEGGYLNVLLGQ
jgi:hypothetical protein